LFAQWLSLPAMPDGDPAVESQLEGFSLWFPLPYRVGFIVTLGAFACLFGFCAMY
jgi:hypothetical protein